MPLRLPRFATVFLLSLLPFTSPAVAQAAGQDAKQEGKPAPGNTLSVQANLVVVPAVISDKHGMVTALTRESFTLAVDGKPQTIRYFDHETDVPLTVGLLVDVSGSMIDNLDEEQKASRSFLESFLAPASGSRPADKAFVMQFARTAELLQDVTDSRPLLAAGLKEIGSQAPDAPPEDNTQAGNSNGSNGGGGTGNGSSNGGYPGGGNNGGYGGHGGYGGGRGGNSGSGSETGQDHPHGGTLLYDAIYLASHDVIGKQTGRRALVVLTDGEDRHSMESLTDTIEAAQRADTVVYGIYYKGQEHRDFMPGGGRRGGYGGYGGGYPGGGGRPGSDGTYARVDGRKVLERICGETGGRVFEVKGKGSMEAIYKQIGDELRAQYRLGFTPDAEAAAAGYHHLQLSLTTANAKKDDIQTRDGYYTGPARAH